MLEAAQRPSLSAACGQASLRVYTEQSCKAKRSAHHRALQAVANGPRSIRQERFLLPRMDCCDLAGLTLGGPLSSNAGWHSLSIWHVRQIDRLAESKAIT